MTHPLENRNRFQDFFENEGYVALKNHLYNYRLRKRAVERVFRDETPSLILEVGSGISPIITGDGRVVYSELSPSACAVLRVLTPQGRHAAADATRLPFASGVFSHAIASEVVEHIEDDRAALHELARVLRPGGRLILTFPHRRDYFGVDDRYVRHWRRYDESDMAERLAGAGFAIVQTEKVLGPFEKLVMSLAVRCFEIWARRRSSSVDGMEKMGKINDPGSSRSASAIPASPSAKPHPDYWRWLAPLWAFVNTVACVIAAGDAWMVPRRWASVLLIVAVKA
ncbi:MAG TPA: methyltransferase domain-containing protein [Candidatus Hydrogenedentes bacterium]|nr:methyltransferase domain-containing protein [Candidatus Hydrogenedentota bacterium]HRT21403.1 methyltransferase domain-containing protein [Candidatus Hydrogenedentota bacterium]